MGGVVDMHVDRTIPAQVESYAESEGVTKLQAAATLGHYHLTKREDYWLEPKVYNASGASKGEQLYRTVNDTLVDKLALSAAKAIQFPKNTAFLHTLGCAASAMRNFRMESFMGGEILRPNIFVIAAQPPSTGKSAINNIAFGPVCGAYKEMNEQTEKRRRLLQMKIERLERDIKQSGSGKSSSKDGHVSLNEQDDLRMCEEYIDEQSKAKNELKEIPYIRPTFTNVTIEALSKAAIEQNGYFNIVSDEAESINVVTGAVYSDSSTNKNNADAILAGWDNGLVSPSRIGRDTVESRVSGTISVLAQYDTIDTILKAGIRGNGVTERFFLLAEDSLLGKRDRTKREKVNPDIQAEYAVMIKNIVNQSEITLTFSEDAEQAFNNYDCVVEAQTAKGGKYAHNMVVGFTQKAGKHCRKLAAILHICENWKEGGKRSLVIDDDFANRAIGMFSELSRTYIDAADSMGHTGTNTEIESVYESFCTRASKPNSPLKMTKKQFYDLVKKKSAFKGINKLMNHLTSSVLPAIEELNWCYFDGKYIHINPRLK